jgi:hypothetical protein
VTQVVMSACTTSLPLRSGSIRTTCGITEAKYGSRAIAATENSQLPSGRPEGRRHAAYVLVEPIMTTYLTLE